MPFDWKEYLEIAKHLQEQGNNNFHTEAAFRCAVSRSYYSAFCHAREYASDSSRHDSVPLFKPCYDSRDHREVKEHYKKYHKQYGHTHLDLQRLRDLRKKCDYENIIDNPHQKASDAIRMAEKIFQKLQ